LPGTLTPVCDYSTWLELPDRSKYVPYFRGLEYSEAEVRHGTLNFVLLDGMTKTSMTLAETWKDDETLVLCCTASHRPRCRP
jgi:hypothetical protein